MARKQKKLTKKQKRIEKIMRKNPDITRQELAQQLRYQKYLRIHRLLMTTSILAVLALGTATFTRFYLPDTYTLIQESIQALSPFAAAPLTTQVVGENTLTDQRKEGVYNFLLLGSDDGHGNADTIIVVNYDAKNNKLNLISVPRDTLVYRSWSSYPKLNAAYSKGADVITNEVSYTLGIPIDYTIEIGLNAFIDVVDQLGGIDYDVPQRMYHDDEGGFIINLQAGQQWLDGRKTLELCRYRGYATADIGRTQTQQAVLKILIQKMLSWDNLSKTTEFIDIFQQYVSTNLSTTDFVWFAKTVLSGADLEIYTQTLNGRGDAFGGSTGWCYELDQADTLEVVNTYLNPFQTDRTLGDMMLRPADGYN